MTLDVELVLDLMAEDLPAAERQVQTLGLTLRRGEGDHAFDLYIPDTAQDGQDYLIRLRCDGYEQQAPSFQVVNPHNPDETAPQSWASITRRRCKPPWKRMAGQRGLHPPTRSSFPLCS